MPKRGLKPRDYILDWLIRPGIIPQVTVSSAHRNVGDDDAKAAPKPGRDQRVNPAIRLTINEIVQIACPAFVSALLEDPASLERLGEQTPNFGIGGLMKLSLLDVAAHDDV